MVWDVKVESLSNLSNKESANKIAEHFAAISNQYLPIDNAQLPCYLPAPQPPQVEEMDVYYRIKGMKKTKSTLPIDIPAPLTTIINNSLTDAVYPALHPR